MTLIAGRGAVGDVEGSGGECGMRWEEPCWRINRTRWLARSMSNTPIDEVPSKENTEDSWRETEESPEVSPPPEVYGGLGFCDCASLLRTPQGEPHGATDSDGTRFRFIRLQ